MVWVYNFYTLLCLLHTQWVTWSIAFTARLSLRALPSPNSQHWYNKPTTRSSRYTITFKDALITAHATFPLVVAHSSLTTSRSLTGRGRRHCYPATIQYPGERRSKHCVRRRAQLPRDHAGVGDDVDTVAGSRTQLPRELCWRCTTAAASEHNSRGDHAQHAGIVDDVDYSVAGSRTQLPRDPCWRCRRRGRHPSQPTAH